MNMDFENGYVRSDATGHEGVGIKLSYGNHPDKISAINFNDYNCIEFSICGEKCRINKTDIKTFMVLLNKVIEGDV